MSQEYRSLIENIVKSNLRFAGNEDLIEDFCSETFKRSYSIISTVNNINSIEKYLSKVASTAILEVLKSSGRLVKLKEGYQKIQETPISIPAIPNVYNTDENDNLLFDVADPGPSIEEKILQQEELNSIRELIITLNAEKQDEKYLEIFTLRYLKHKKQAEIAEELNISQGEVSKRLVQLMKSISELLNK
jgi:RNA polymerase sigma factor (sigma-70 family)